MKKTLTPLLLAALAAAPASAAVDVLHAFDGGLGGSRPQAAVTLVGGTVYGVTNEGGASGAGSLYRVGADGSGFQKLHDFDALADPSGEGSFPNGPLAHVAGELFGVTEFGGAAFDGVVYRIGTDGAGYAPVHEFDQNAAEAVSPSGGVLVDGTSLFGTTLFGATLTEGSVYAVQADGSGFAVLHGFASDGSQGEEIEGPLEMVGSDLWGVAAFGGGNDGGTLFRVGTNGSGFEVLHEFGDADDGATPVGGVLNSDGLMFGATREGGASGEGTLYEVDGGGTGYGVIYDFAGGPTDGAAPVGRLVQVDGRLFGVTERGGPSDLGTVYSVAEDGSGFRLHHAFRGFDGASPLAGLTHDGQTLYGVASAGGADDGGVLFALDPNALDGDYNADGRVDAADYTVWRDALDSTTDLAADGDFSGVIDAGDYAVWQANYGRAVAAAVGVPEPATWTVTVGLVAAAWARRRR